MLWVPQKGVMRSSATAVSVTTGGASNTKGTPVQLFASVGFDAFLIEVVAYGYGASATTSQCCLDILIGAATESVLIPNLLAGFCGGDTAAVGCGPKRWLFPIYIPAGSRLAVQAAGDRTSTAFSVYVSLYGGQGYPPFRVGSRVNTYGITTVPAGTDVAAGYSGAEGAWVAIATSTNENNFCIVPSFHPTDGDTTFSNIQQVSLDIGIGGAGAEQAIGLQNYTYRIDTNERCEGPWNYFPTFQDIPAGTRLSTRLSYSGATDTGEPDCALHCVS
jgi:hypothetical protein